MSRQPMAPLGVSRPDFPTAIERFLRYMGSERGGSPLTVKSYREDLLQLGVVANSGSR